MGHTNVALDYDKDLKEHDAFRPIGWYNTTLFDINEFPIYNASFDPPLGVNHIVLIGSGGTGKSYSVYKDSNLIDTLYVVASRALGEDKRKEFNCNFTTVHRMLGDITDPPCAPYTDNNPVPSIAMADEITQYDKTWVDNLLLRYPKTFWLIAGDVDYDRWYQCRSGANEVMYDIWLPSRSDFVVPYLKDYRSKDDELRILKERMREQMKLVFTDGRDADTYKLGWWLTQNYKKYVVNLEKALTMYKKGDIFLSGKHKTNTLLMEKGVISGSQDRITKRIYYEEGEGKTTRGSFTVHSFQGLTIEDRRVFITLDFFEYSMLATALGRVRNMSQLVFVN